MQQAPIGIFDSGIGGLSVAREIHRLLPHEALYYLADARYAPYGERSREQIIQRSHYCTQQLIERGAKAIVIACNTATAAAVNVLRAAYPLPIIAMEPALKPAVQASRNGCIGVLATAGTLGSEKFARLQEQFAGHCRVFTQPCPGLVEEIEKGDFDSLDLRQLLERYIHSLKQQGVDTLILGCTHYPLVRPRISAVAGPGIEIIDSGPAVARRVAQLLGEQQQLNPQATHGPLSCWSSAELSHYQQLLPKLWPGQLLTLAAL